MARTIAALGPRVLALAGERAAGAHPHLTTLQHSAQARVHVGSSAFPAPEQKVVLSTHADEARAVARRNPWAPRSSLSNYPGMRNYLNSWKRLGFSQSDFAGPGSDAVVDPVIAYGALPTKSPSG